MIPDRKGSGMNHKAATGCLVGTAIGDALGLPYEGLPPRRGLRLLGDPDRFRFLFGRGVVSDDTEHACLTWLALVASQGDETIFASELAANLRYWFLALPPGTGLATARACLKLCLGCKPHRSGVFSAGNGPAMRAPILGAAIDDLDQLQNFVGIATRITHTDPRAEQAAYAIALATWTARQQQFPTTGKYFELVRQRLSGESAQELLRALTTVEISLLKGQSTIEFAAERYGPRGVSGYALHTVPVVLHAWLSHPQDYPSAVMSVIRCGGDADSTAAILGGIIGAGTGQSGIPEKWINTLMEWPHSIGFIHKITAPVQSGHPSVECRRWLWYIPILLRNLLMLAVVLFHGFRRMLPPY